ncbi:MAG TPA: class I SAM-dependent methyltransferase [Gaiellaceae bacterium]|nr:class I SAM-dependent methyltransferase [Gaiellaceae bacterium]
MPDRRLERGPAEADDGRSPATFSSDELYGELWADESSALDVELDRSLEPRGTMMLYDELARLGVGAESVVLDAGARDAAHAVEIVRRLGCRVIAVDPVPLHVERARERVAEAELDGLIDVVQAGIESLPLADSSIDAVWCRDVLNHVPPGSGLRELARVLSPGGSVLVYQTFAEQACEPEEARRLFAGAASLAESMSAPFFETAAAEAGFDVVSREQLHGEWRERMLEDGTWDVSADLLALSRLHRRERELVERYGHARVEAMRSGRLWGVYQLLGKTCPTIYVLRLRL